MKNSEHIIDGDLYEVRHFNPAEDETKWIVILKSKPLIGEPNYHSIFAYSFLKDAEALVVKLNAAFAPPAMTEQSGLAAPACEHPEVAFDNSHPSFNRCGKCDARQWVAGGSWWVRATAAPADLANHPLVESAYEAAMKPDQPDMTLEELKTAVPATTDHDHCEHPLCGDNLLCCRCLRNTLATEPVCDRVDELPRASCFQVCNTHNGKFQPAESAGE